MTVLIPETANRQTQRAWRRLIRSYGRRKVRETVEAVEVLAALDFPLRLELSIRHCQHVYGSRGLLLAVYRLVIQHRIELGLPIDASLV